MILDRVKNSKDIVIALRRDEMIFLMTQCLEFWKEKEPRCGLPYLRDDLTDDIYNFNVLKDENYNELVCQLRKKDTP